MLVNARLPPCAQRVTSFFMKQKKKLNISFLEKDDKYGNLIREYVKIHDWNMTLFNNADDILTSFVNTDQDILIFDIEDNTSLIHEITEKIRAVNSNIFIIFIGDVKYGDSNDFYLEKPFALQDLTELIINREDNSKKTFQLGSIIFNSEVGTIIAKGEEKRLSSKERKLLFLLCNNMNKIVERSVALETIWNCNDYFNARSMDVYLSKLRKLFSEEPKVRIENVLRKGFILHVEE